MHKRDMKTTYSLARGTQCSVVTWMGKRAKGEGIYVHVQLIHFAVQQNQHDIVKQLHTNKSILEKETTKEKG